MNIGEYGRTNLGNIIKFAWLEKENGIKDDSRVILIDRMRETTNCFYYFKKGEIIINHSKEPKDLVQEGDFVNGMQVQMFYDTYNERTGEYEDILGFPIYDDGLMDCITEVAPLTSIEIKSIVTREMMKSVEYRFE